MPQYLAPGVYVEEIPGPRTIAGVSTSTAGFVGPTRFGPTSGKPELLTSYLDFVRIYGDAVDLQFTTGPATPAQPAAGGNPPVPAAPPPVANPILNHMALAVKAFFDEGGSSLYVSRVFSRSDPNTADLTTDHGTATPTGAGITGNVSLLARFPGAAGNVEVTLTLVVGNNVLVTTGATKRLSRVQEYDLVWVEAGGTKQAQVVRRDPATNNIVLKGQGAANDEQIAALTKAYPLTVRVDVQKPTTNAQGVTTLGPPVTLGEFAFDTRSANGIGAVLSSTPPTRAQALTLPLILTRKNTPADPDAAAVDMLAGLFTTATTGKIADPTAKLSDMQTSLGLSGGYDGLAPTEATYGGDPGFTDYQANAADEIYNGLLAFEPVDDISIVCAPGAASGWGKATADIPAYLQGVQNEVINHCERMLYRTAALDTPAGLLPSGALDFRNLRSSTHAALYYPWVTVSHPIDGSRVSVPPAALMTGIWARSDNARGVIKAPANEVIRSALDLEIHINKAQQELLNPQGVNCLRFFPGPGFEVWGARTISEDPEWKYLSIRRYFNYLEKSIDEGTQWVVFEINNPALWAAVRTTIEGFLLTEWKSGALLGAKPEQGFFVRCDASTMTSDDLDNGRLIVQIGVSAARPAEFVIFRISQLTASTAS